MVSNGEGFPFHRELVVAASTAMPTSFWSQATSTIAKTVARKSSFGFAMVSGA